MRTFILISLILLQATTYSQNHKDNIVGKKWYAIKVFTGGPAMPKHTEFAPQEDCTSFSLGRHYYFYMDLKSNGTIETDFKFSSLNKPVQFSINGDSLIMSFSNTMDYKVDFQIIESTQDFLQITGPNDKTYFLISDRQLQ